MKGFIPCVAKGKCFAMNTVLLIDDDEGILAAFGLALRNHGYRVFEATTGTAGFELAKQQLPDIIITDIAMPGGDGEDLLQRIRQHPDLANKQVVLMTGEVHRLGPRRGMEVGADDFLVKPVSLEALLSCVEARLKRAQVHWRVEDRALERLRSSLHSNLPHEFFTPLGGILGLTDILRAEWTSLPATEVKDLLGDIHHSALRLHRTLRNYLMVLELRDVGDPARLPPPLPAHEVEERIWSGVRTAARRHGRKSDIKVQIEPCSILVQPDDLSVLVEELVDNASHYSRQGTPVTVELNGNGVLTVTDAGRGMTPEELQKVGVFQQFERPGKEQQGLGIGLVLVHRLAAKCGTKPVIESTVGQGTKIRAAFLKPSAAGK
jgi:two-component system, sensor histidine kinase and response regulator